MNFGKITHHRNSQKRFYLPGACYFVTVKTHNNFPYFNEEIFCKLFVEELKICKKIKSFNLYGWFLGYDHFHMLMQPGDKFNYSKIMQFLKCHTSRNINIIINQNPAPPTYEGAIGQSRLHNNALIMFDEYVHHLKIQFLLKYSHPHVFPQFRWQKSFFDHYIRDPNDFMNHLAYIAGNPSKHNMPRKWPYIFTNPAYQNLIDNF